MYSIALKKKIKIHSSINYNEKLRCISQSKLMDEIPQNRLCGINT